MRKNILRSFVISTILLLFVLCTFWIILFRRGRRFALRDHLQKADAIVVLAGTRGNINFLNGKFVRLFSFIKKGGHHTLFVLENLA